MNNPICFPYAAVEDQPSIPGSAFDEDLSYELGRKQRMAERDAALLISLRAKFGVPPEFEALAVQIWWDGKED